MEVGTSISHVNQHSALHSATCQVNVRQTESFPVRLNGRYFLDSGDFLPPFEIRFECLRFALSEGLVRIGSYDTAESEQRTVSDTSTCRQADGNDTPLPVLRFSVDHLFCDVRVLRFGRPFGLVLCNSLAVVLAVRSRLCFRDRVDIRVRVCVRI